MVLKKLVSFISNLVVPRVQPRIKDASFCKLIAMEVSEDVLKSSRASNSGSADCTDGEDGELCCVCLSRLKIEEIRVLPCLHKFHKVCVERWFNVSRQRCPLCRFSMGEEENSYKREDFTEEMVIWFSSFHGAGF